MGFQGRKVTRSLLYIQNNNAKTECWYSDPQGVESQRRFLHKQQKNNTFLKMFAYVMQKKFSCSC